ncbi:MAG: hypothetical protein ACRD2B_03445 [Terriglobia bacterium]
MINVRRVLAVTLLVVGIPFAARAAGASSRTSRFPSPDWPVARDLRAAGTSQERVHAFDAWLRNHGGRSWAAVVIMDGYLVYEGHGARCYVRMKNDCGSIDKAVYSTVLGVALYQKKLSSLDEKAMRYWKDPFVTPYAKDRSITFRQFAMFKGDWDQPTLTGTFFDNNGGATAAAACVAGLFTHVSGPRPQGMAQVARKEVAEKIGADWTLWYWAADFLPKPGDSGPQMVLDSSVYELAKLGYLWLNRGRWKNARIFGVDYYKEATTDWSPNTGSRAYKHFCHMGFWWYVNDHQVLLPGVPADAFYAIGNGEPKRATCLLVIPSFDAVAVLSMSRLSDDGKWDVIKNGEGPSNDGPRLFAAQVARLRVVSSR